MRDPASREDAQENAEENRQESQKAPGALHFVNAAIGFVARLLDDYRPIERGNGTVRPQHFDAVLAIANREFASRYQLGLGSIVHESANDIERRHVLSGGKFGGRSGNQASLAVNDVWDKAGAVHFLKAADQELKIDYAADHSKETVAVQNRCADQKHGSCRFAAAYHQRLTAIAAFFMGRGIGAFEFALQKGVRLDAAGGNSFGIEVQDGRIGDVVRGRNEMFQQ